MAETDISEDERAVTQQPPAPFISAEPQATPAEDVPTPSRPIVPTATVGREEFRQIMDILGPGQEAEKFSQALVNSLVYDPRIDNEDRSYISYEGLRSGQAGVLRELERRSRESGGNLDFSGGLTDSDIIQIFGRDAEGRPFRAGGSEDFFEGMRREAAPAAGGFAGFMAGAARGNAMVSGIPPTTPITAATRILTPLVTGMMGATIGDIGARTAQAEIYSGEPLFVPGTAAAYEAGKSTMGALAWLPMPWLIPKNVNLGAQAVIQNLTAGARAPRSTRVVGAIEGGINRLGQAARGEKGRLAQFGVLASETAAAGGTGFGAYRAEEMAPGDPYFRFAAELGGGIGGGFAGEAVSRRIGEVLFGSFSAVKNTVQRASEESAVNAAGQLSDRQKANAANYFLDQLEANGEDPEEIIRLLTQEPILDPETGAPMPVDAGILTGSPTIVRVLQNAGADPEAAQNAQNAVDAIRRSILFIYANGDRAAIGQMAEVQTGLWEMELSAQIEAGTSRLLENIAAVGRDVDSLENAEIVRRTLDEISGEMRRQENQLWRQVPFDLETDTFLRPDGSTSDVPNFVDKWEELTYSATDAPEALAAILRIPELRDLYNYVQRKGSELGLEGYADVNQASVAELPELGRRDRALLEIDGTARADRYRSFLSKISDLPTNEQVERLRAEAQESRGRFSTELSRKYANLIDREAELLIAREQQASAAAADPLGSGDGDIPGTVSVRELYAMRNTALNAGRYLSAQGNPNGARIAYGMAEALLADMDSFEDLSFSYNNARAYSRAYNDVWTRGYGGEVLNTRRTGAAAIPPELLADRLFKGDAGYLRARQIDEIGQTQIRQSLTTLLGAEDQPAGRALLASAEETGVFDSNTGFLNVEKFNQWFDTNQTEIDAIPGLRDQITRAVKSSVSLRGPVENILREARAASFDLETGAFNERELRRWMRRPQNARLLEAFPAVKEDLENLQTARAALTEVTGEVARQRQQNENGLLSLYELLPDKTENPASQVSRAISFSNPRPFAELNSLWDNIEAVGDSFQVTSGPLQGQTFTRQELENGFRTAILESAFNRGGIQGRVFNVQVAFETLFEAHPNSTNNTSVADWMIDKGIMSAAELGRVRQFLGRMSQIQAFSAGNPSASVEEYVREVGPAFTLMARITGANLGSRIGQNLGGSQSGLIAPAAGSAFAQRIMNTYLSDLPASMRMDVINMVVSNPQLLAEVLQRGRNERQQVAVARSIGNALVEYGLVSPARRAGPAVQNVLEQDPVEMDALRGYLESVRGEQEQEAQPAPAAPAPRPAAPAPSPADRTNLVPPSGIPTPGGGAAPRPVQTPPAAPVGPTPTPPPSGPVDRSRFAALFPEDRALMEGIGSLAPR